MSLQEGQRPQRRMPMNTDSKNQLLAATVCLLVGGSAACPAAAAAATQQSAGIGAAISDTAVTAKVKARLATDERIKGSDIDVTTNNGVVTLTGTAASSTARHAAQELAGNVRGVHAVNNQISAPSASSELGDRAKRATEKTATAVSDTAITAEIKARYAADSTLRGSDVSVRTSNSVVELSGSVKSTAQKAHVVDMARRARGVSQVDSTALAVQDE